MSSEFHNVCRACLAEDAQLKSLFSLEQMQEQPIHLYEMFTFCTSIMVNKDDRLPNNICEMCLQELLRAFSFRKICEKSDILLRDRLTEPSNVENALKSQQIRTSTFDETEIDSSENKAGSDGFGNLDCSSNRSCSPDGSSDETDQQKPISDAHLQEPLQKQQRKPYTCEVCKDTFPGLSSYWRHMAQNHDRITSCDLCSRKFKSEKALARHKRMAHEKQHQSSAPTPKFDSPKFCTENTKNNKTDIAKKKKNLPRTCELCNKTFRFHSNLERHKLIHTGEKPYLCNVCGKGFAQMSYLRIHSFIHTGEKPYRCRLCDKSFAAPGTLMTHVRVHTGERPHSCKICGKDFPQSGYLAAHVRTHTGEKPTECKVCHKRFNQRSRLNVHMRTHSGEKPYKCKECDKCFAVKGTLKKHMRTHTGERPYVCSVCGQAFAQGGTLATHMKVHNRRATMEST